MATSTYFGWAEPDDTDLVKNGASAMRTLGNAIDSTLWTVGGYTAGKNKIINGDFGINQRAFTSTTSSATFTFDRWISNCVDGTTTITSQAFTAGSAPVAGYESTNYLQIASTGQTATNALSAINQRIEDVRAFAGQTITLSFWAKASSGTPSIAAYFFQAFGAGGSSSVNINGNKTTISTSWARYSFTISIPSLSGQTVGSNSYLQLRIVTSAGSDYNTNTNSIGIQTATISIWGVQLEAGATATSFQTATGTKQGELAACQRYYVRFANTSNANATVVPSGIAYSATTFPAVAVVPTTLRTNPTSIEYANLQIVDSGFSQYTVTNVAISQNGNPFIICDFTASGMTAARSGWVRQSSTSGYLAFNAEL